MAGKEPWRSCPRHSAQEGISHRDYQAHSVGEPQPKSKVSDSRSYGQRYTQNSILPCCLNRDNYGL